MSSRKDDNMNLKQRLAVARETTVRLLERFGQVWLSSLARRRAVPFDTDPSTPLRYVVLERKRELDFERSLQRGDETGGTGLVMVNREDQTGSDALFGARKTKGLFAAYKQRRGRASIRSKVGSSGRGAEGASIHRQKLLDGMTMLTLPGVVQQSSDKASAVVSQPGTFGTQFLALVTSQQAEGRPGTSAQQSAGQAEAPQDSASRGAVGQGVQGGATAGKPGSKKPEQASIKGSWAGELEREMSGLGMETTEGAPAGPNGEGEEGGQGEGVGDEDEERDGGKEGGGSPSRRRVRRQSVCTLPAIALPHLESPEHLAAIKARREALHAIATASLGRFAENLEYTPGPPVDGTGPGGGEAGGAEDRQGKLQLAHDLVSTLDKRGAAGGSTSASAVTSESKTESALATLPPTAGGAPGGRRGGRALSDLNAFRRPVATDRKPLQMPWHDLVMYAAQRMDCKYTRRKFVAQVCAPRCLQLVEECFWFVHLQLFGGLGEDGAAGGGGSGGEGSGLAPELQQELVLQRISRLYVSIVSGTKANRDHLLDHLPFLASGAAFLAYFYCLPGSRRLYTPQLKLRLIMIVVRLVTGSDMTPVAVLRLYTRYFPDEIPLPREVTERIAQQYAGLPAAGTEADGRMAQTVSRRSSLLLRSQPGASLRRASGPGAPNLGSPTGPDDTDLSRSTRRTPNRGPKPESLADATLRRTKAAQETRRRIVEEVRKSVVDFDTSMTTPLEHGLLGYIDAGNVETLRSLPLGDILPPAVKATLLEGAQREARQEAAAARSKKAKAKAAKGGDGDDGTVQQSDSTVDGRQKAAAALLNPGYRPLLPLGGGKTSQEAKQQGGGSGKQTQQQQEQAVGTAARVPRAQALLVTRTRTKPLTVAFNIRQRSGLVQRALAGEQQHSASHAASQFMRASQKGKNGMGRGGHAESAPALGLGQHQQQRQQAAAHRQASAVARDGASSDLSSELGSWAAGGRGRSSTIGSQVAVRLARSNSTSTIGAFEEDQRRESRAAQRAGQEANEVVRGGAGVGRTVRRYVPLPWEVNGGIETVRVTKTRRGISKQVLSRQQVVRSLARRVVQISDEAQDAIASAAAQVKSDISSGLVRGVSKFARDVQTDLQGRETQKRQERREAGGSHGATKGGKSRPSVAVLSSAKAKTMAEEVKAGIDLESYRMRVEYLALPDVLMQEGTMSAAEQIRIKQMVSRAAQEWASANALRKSGYKTASATTAEGAASSAKKSDLGSKTPSRPERQAKEQAKGQAKGQARGRASGAAADGTMKSTTRGATGGGTGRSAVGRRAPVSGAFLLRPDQILNGGRAGSGASAATGGRGGPPPPAERSQSQSQSRAEEGEAEQKLAALEQTLLSIRATNRSGLDGAPRLGPVEAAEESQEQAARRRAKAARAASQTAAMSAEGIAPPPRRAGMDGGLPRPSPLLAFHDAADRRAQRQDVAWQIRNGQLVKVRKVPMAGASSSSIPEEVTGSGSMSGEVAALD